MKHVQLSQVRGENVMDNSQIIIKKTKTLVFKRPDDEELAEVEPPGQR